MSAWLTAAGAGCEATGAGVCGGGEAARAGVSTPLTGGGAAARVGASAIILRRTEFKASLEMAFSVSNTPIPCSAAASK